MRYKQQKQEIIAEILGLLKEKFVEPPFGEDIIFDMVRYLEKRDVYNEDRKWAVSKYSDTDIIQMLRNGEEFLRHGRLLE